MLGVSILIVFALVYLLLPWWAERRDDGAPATGLLVGFWRHSMDATAGWAVALYATAVLATFALVLGGVDSPAQAWFQQHDPLGSTISRAVLVVGNFWPFILALVLYLLGRRRDPRLAGAGVASFQALAAVLLWVTLLKVVTGRPPPHHFVDGAQIVTAFRTTSDATDFSFLFWSHAFADGRFMWPSGHTASAMGVVSALVAYAPERRWLAWVGYPVVAFTALAMVDGDFHWTSDVVAGALIGHAIGWSIGRSVRADPRFDPQQAPPR